MELSFGIASIIGALVYPCLYLINRIWRQLGAMATRTERPKEVVGVFLVLGIVIGGFAGSMVQPRYDQFMLCHEQGRSVRACIFDPSGLFEQKAPTTSPAYPQSRGSSKSR